MAGKDNYMDETCAWLQTLVQWASHRPSSPIHFAGIGSTFGNRPAGFLELVYLTQGCITELKMGPARTAMKQGQLGLFNVHFGNEAPASDRFRGWCVFLDISGDIRFEVLAHAPLALVADVRDAARVDLAFEMVVERCRATAWSPPGYQAATQVARRTAGVATQALLKAALLELLGTLLEEATQDTASGPAAGLPAGISDAVSLIHREYHKPSLGRLNLAKAAAMHPDHFTRLFRQRLKVSPMRYLAQVRIAQASFLLTHTDQRVADVASQVGFEDAFHFSRVFRDQVKVSPRGYRQKTQRAAGETDGLGSNAATSIL